MTNPEKAQLIHPPITIMGRTLVRFPFIMSVSMLESATEEPHLCSPSHKLLSFRPTERHQRFQAA